jgi:hypothetical protein
MLYVGISYCKLRLCNLMARYHCRIVLKELSMSTKIFSHYRLRSGKDSNLAFVEYKPDPLPHSQFPNTGTIYIIPYTNLTSSRLYPLVEKLYKRDEFIGSYADPSSITRAAALITITEDFSPSQDSHCGISSP